MKVNLTFDIEVWCNGWKHLDRDFPTSYARYVFGRSKHGDYALPKALEILSRQDLHAVFFVEPLFSARFGGEYLERVVRMIDQAGQEVQLHLHPEWTDEIVPAPIADVSRKRQYLHQYSLEEQVALVAFAKQRLEDALGRPVTSFRAGSYSANAHTYQALAANGIKADSSINACYSISGPELVGRFGTSAPFSIHGVTVFPVSTFRDGFGRMRPAQVGACSFAEVRQALESARDAGWTNFVIVSHNFEMLAMGKSKPDWIVVRRFERLCRFLSDHRATLPVCGFNCECNDGLRSDPLPGPRATAPATALRYVEQIMRRVTH